MAEEHSVIPSCAPYDVLMTSWFASSRFKCLRFYHWWEKRNVSRPFVEASSQQIKSTKLFDDHTIRNPGFLCCGTYFHRISRTPTIQLTMRSKHWYVMYFSQSEWSCTEVLWIVFSGTTVREWLAFVRYTVLSYSSANSYIYVWETM